MSKSPPDFEENFERYLKDVSLANSEASKSYLFLEFIRNTFKQVNVDYSEKLYPDLEKHLVGKTKTLTVKGRPDAMLGNLIIEFKKKLDEKSKNEAESELRRYISILWTQQKERRIQYVAIATDGINFVCYRPRADPGEVEVIPSDVFLDEIDKINLTRTNPGEAFVWLDRYILSKARRPPTAEAFSNEFGLNKPAFRDSEAFLKQAWKESEEKVLYDQWAGFLRIVYGSSVDSEDLFIRHSYLATLAKLLVYSSFSGGAIPVSSEQVCEILEGKIFEKWNVHNFLEEDFFSWVARTDSGIKAAQILLDRLASYDLSTVDEDILKSLYQELVDPNARHELGEYYTPDWLAELMIERILKDDPDKSVLDPACGSGTFLAACIRKKKQLLRSRRPIQQLQAILTSVRGVDVHPLAVILARTNFLTALGTDLLFARRGPISVPVYLADSIRLPESDVTIYEGVKSFKIQADKKILRLPVSITVDPDLTDKVVEGVKEYARKIAEGDKPKLDDFSNIITQKINREIDSKSIVVLFDSARAMAELIKLKRDTVWAFILKNIYKPLFLKDKKFDVVVGNPPWLSYRYVESTDYQKFLKNMILNEYNLLDTKRAELITQMELATLFFARCSDLYLADEGIISFVMPRSIFVSDHHHNFRRGKYKPNMRFIEILDLEHVDPLFRVPSCVITAKKGINVYPVDTIVLKGRLLQRNTKLKEALRALNQENKKFTEYAIGDRSFLEDLEFETVLKAIDRGKKSYYYESFTQGATIVPRQLWFIEPQVHPKLGIDPTQPRLKTSQRAIEKAKKEYEDVIVEGEVESQFLYLVVTGSEIAPFSTTKLPLVVLPIEPKGGKYHIIHSEEAKQKGYSGLYHWLIRAEEVWSGKRGEKADKMTIYDRLDYQRGLSDQRSRVKYRVLYNTSGTYLVSCIVVNKPSNVKVDSSSIRVSGVVADAKVYRYDTDDENEALFLSALLNAPIIDSLIKPMQSRGQFGERDIHKKVLELPLPKFNPRKNEHMMLVNLAKRASEKASKIVPELEKQYSGIGKIRQLVKAEIEEEVLQIDKIVRELIVSEGELPDGLYAFL